MFFFALVVICSAILVFFLDEISAAVRKLFTQPNEHMLIPVVLCSGMAFAYEDQLKVYLGWLHAILDLAATYLGLFMPLLLWAMISLPVCALYVLIKHKTWGNALNVASCAYLILWTLFMSIWIA